MLCELDISLVWWLCVYDYIKESLLIIVINSTIVVMNITTCCILVVAFNVPEIFVVRQFS